MRRSVIPSAAKPRRKRKGGHSKGATVDSNISTNYDKATGTFTATGDATVSKGSKSLSISDVNVVATKDGGTYSFDYNGETYNGSFDGGTHDVGK